MQYGRRQCSSFRRAVYLFIILHVSNSFYLIIYLAKMGGIWNSDVNFRHFYEDNFDLFELFNLRIVPIFHVYT